MLTDFHRPKYHFSDKSPCVEIVNVLFRIINYIWFILTRFKKWKYQIFIRDFLTCLVTVKSGRSRSVPSGISMAFQDILEDSLINDSMKAEIIVTLIRLRSYSIWREVMVLRDGLSNFFYSQVYQFSLISGLKLVYLILIS